MIETLSLRNWKSYSSLLINFTPGPNFLVAKNGIGKTSIIQAIHFALFGGEVLLGSKSPLVNAIRGGSSETEVSLGLVLDGTPWRIVRRVDHHGEQIHEITRNQSSVGPSSWDAALSAACAIDSAELSSLVTIAEGEMLSSVPGEYNIVKHLSNALGVDRLSSEARRLRSRALETSKSADNRRLELRDRPLKESAADRQSLISDLEALEAQRAPLESKLLRLREEQDRIRQWEHWEAATLRASNQAAETVASIISVLDDIDEVIPEQNVAPRIPDNDRDIFASLAMITAHASDVRSMIESAIEAADRRSASAGARRALATQALELLASGDAICPTCRRPLSSTEHREAVEENESLAADLRGEAEDADTQSQILRRSMRQLVQVTQISRIEPLPYPGSVRPSTESSPRELEEAISETEKELRSHDERRGSLGGAISEIDRRIETARHNESLTAELTKEYLRADLFLSASMAFEAAAETICAQRIEPLAHELGKRWNGLWPSRPKVQLDPRTGLLGADANGAKIDLKDLSGGERAVAVLILRILAVQAASRSPFMFLDEPLEHLDPRNRRMLANLLVSAANSSGTPSQIVVTTYEENVARRINAFGEGSSSVTYVR